MAYVVRAVRRGRAPLRCDPAGDRVAESDEQYLLSLDREVSAKIRDGLMDVKVLEHRRDDGLEQWRPIMKAEFPISAAEVTTLLGALGADTSAEGHRTLTLEELLREVIQPNPRLRAVAVHKRREHTTIGGCMAERADDRRAGKEQHTIAVEEEDPELVMTTARELGIADRRNVAVPRVLATLAGFGARRFAVIDVGTNSVKFHVGERAADGTWRTVADRAEVTRLGEGLAEHGRFGERADGADGGGDRGMADEAQRAGRRRVGRGRHRRACARRRTARTFVDAVRERTGIEIEVISGADEARLAYRALRAGLRSGGAAGGVRLRRRKHAVHVRGGRRVDEQFSLDVGAVNVTERYGLAGAVGEAELQRRSRASRRASAAARPARPDDGGRHGRHGHEPGRRAARAGGLRPGRRPRRDAHPGRDRPPDRAVPGVRTDERRAIRGLQANRAEVILGGACIVRGVLSCSTRTPCSQRPRSPLRPARGAVRRLTQRRPPSVGRPAGVFRGAGQPG